MTTLHLGVLDIPYNEAPEAGAEKVVSGTQTTGDVAGWLENRYDIMQTFFDNHAQQIADDLTNSLAGALETILMGGPRSPNPFASGTEKVETAFRKFLDDEEMNGHTRLYDGKTYPVPTGAATRGVNHRLKIKRGPPRASFIDTGLYQSSFRAWID